MEVGGREGEWQSVTLSPPPSVLRGVGGAEGGQSADLRDLFKIAYLSSHLRETVHHPWIASGHQLSPEEVRIRERWSGGEDWTGENGCRQQCLLLRYLSLIWLPPEPHPPLRCPLGINASLNTGPQVLGNNLLGGVDQATLRQSLSQVHTYIHTCTYVHAASCGWALALSLHLVEYNMM